MANIRQKWHTLLMATVSALDLPVELRAIRPCEHGLVLLQAFLSQPRNSTPPAQPYRAFRGIRPGEPSLSTGRTVLLASKTVLICMTKCGTKDPLDAGSTVRCAITIRR